jgi:hypothetical protein
MAVAFVAICRQADGFRRLTMAPSAAHNWSATSATVSPELKADQAACLGCPICSQPGLSSRRRLLPFGRRSRNGPTSEARSTRDAEQSRRCAREARQARERYRHRQAPGDRCCLSGGAAGVNPRARPARLGHHTEQSRHYAPGAQRGLRISFARTA